MRKIKFFFLTLVALLGAVTASAAEYTVDFNTPIAVPSNNHSDPMFQVSTGWTRIADRKEGDGYYGTAGYYMRYTYSSTAGVGSTGTLLANAQQAPQSTYDGYIETVHDYIVTPKVSGTVTLQVKGSTSASNALPSFINFYTVDDDATTVGDEIVATYSADLNTSDFVTATLTLTEATRIAIRAQWVYMDNFTATSAEIPEVKALTVTSVMNTDGQSEYTGTNPSFEQQPDGTLLVKLKVAIQNTGNVDLVASSVENFTLTLASASSTSATKTYYEDANITLTEDLAVGESTTIEVEKAINYTDTYGSYRYWFVRENVSGTTSSSYRYATSVAYEPKFVFRKAGSSSTSSLSPAEAWGTIKESTTKNYEIFNNGTAPLIVNSIAIPEGYTTDPAGTDVVLFRTSGYNADGAVWYAWTWNTDDGVWVPETDGKFTGLKNNVLFVRMNPEAAGAPDWSKEWNRTGDLAVQAGKTYVIDSWGANYGDPVVGHWAAAVVAKGETKAINITNDASVTGTFANDLVIKYLDKNADEQTYTLGFSTTVIGANTWTADFNVESNTDTNYPAGSVAENGIRFGTTYVSSNNYDGYLYSYTSTSYANANNKFITPKLHANAGDKLAFDVRRDESGSTTYNLKVYVSTDRKTWGEPVYTETANNLTTSFQTKEISFDETGDYYVAFAIYGVRLDNLVGLEKVDVAHDLYIKSVSWPDASINSGVAQTRPSVDIIPLTDETAEAYTVKYVCGETVLAEGTPVALTASASSTKTFSFNWTPNVESTTVYENTKVVLDFGGGVTFETDPFTLTVVKEPKFHFVKTLPSNKLEPTDYTTPITFGKTNTADTQTFYVYNWGTAQLTVKSISVPTGFTVTPTDQFTVAAFDENNLSASSQAVTITFSAATPGNYSGNMVITYENDQTFEIAVSGIKLDPTKFYANFDNATENSCNWPAGSVYQDNISNATVSYSAPYNYYISSSSTTNNIFVTPKLAATAGEKLMFDAKLYSSYWNSGAVKVYAATTREEVLNTEEGTTRVQLFYASGVDAGADATITTDYQTFEVTVPEAGEYYFGFEISGRPYVDELYGLTPVAVEHDWMVASSSIPTDAMQNVAKNASVNLLNLGLADEAADSYEVNLYIGGEKAASAETTPALAMNHKLTDAGTQVTVPMQSPKAGTFPVYIEVKAGAYSIATEPVDVTFAEEVAESNLTMSTGTASTTNLLHLNWNNSETVSLYSATVLSNMGLKEGDKISSITYKGYNTGSKDYSTTLNVWYEFTDETTQSQPAAGKYDTSEMTNVLNTTRSWASVEGTSSNYVELITINFETPIVYTAGKSLRMVVCSEGSQYQSGTYFVPSTVSGTSTSYYNRNDTQSSFENTQTWSANSYLPAIYIGLAVESKTYSGTVKDNNSNPIENATVTLVSTDGKNIQYAGLTDENGVYSINVIQSSRTYDATATAYGYDDAADADISFADNVVKYFVLTRKENVSVTVTSAEWATITTPATYAVSFDKKTEVYIATGEEGGNIKLTKIDDAPAMTPIVIHATAGAYTMTQKATATSDVSANILESAKGTEVGDGAGNYYVLGILQSTGVGFGKLASGVTLAKGKAYIPGTALANISDFLPFVIGDEDETTTINAVDAAGMDDDTPVYNLAGQKVGKDYKGVVIVNGRKVVRK